MPGPARTGAAVRVERAVRWPMADIVLLCADGSDLSTAALRAGIELLGTDRPYVVAVVVDPVDPMLATGSGFAGGTMTPEELGELEQLRHREGAALAERVTAELGLADATTRVLDGHAGARLVQLAAELDAAAVVIGSRGRGGIKRALLGSVSDHVVRHAPCPVVVWGAAADEAPES